MISDSQSFPTVVIFLYDFNHKVKFGDGDDRGCAQAGHDLDNDIRICHRILDRFEDEQECSPDHQDGVEEGDEDGTQLPDCEGQITRWTGEERKEGKD